MQDVSIYGRALAISALSVCLGLVGCGGDSAEPGGQPFDAEVQATSDEPVEPIVQGLPDFTELVKQVSPAVVNISAMPPKPAAGGPPLN